MQMEVAQLIDEAAPDAGGAAPTAHASYSYARRPMAVVAAPRVSPKSRMYAPSVLSKPPSRM